MVLDRKRKVLAGVLGAAVAVFVADRLLGVIPTGSEESGSWDSPAAQAAAPGPRPPRSLVPEVTLAERLERHVADANVPVEAVRDAFRPPASWNPAPVAPPPAPDEDARRVAAFTRAHRLKATSVGPKGRVALVDEKCLAAGQMLDGWRLREVGHDHAVFRNGELEATLRLPELQP